jgi:hypothetical protein
VLGYVKGKSAIWDARLMGWNRIFSVRNSGHEDIVFQPLDWMSRRYRSISGPRKRLIRNWIN